MSPDQQLSPQAKIKCDKHLAKLQATDQLLEELDDDLTGNAKQIDELKKSRAGIIAYLRANCPGYLDDPEKPVKKVKDSEVENV